ncbi:helix-turn-helix domain-containing protein [Enterococcus cecorum]|uniref:helix-turn-helix domain-containing protein n=1 Tax=Enterococcus cecorum TaxID=44008 RepID=UPI00148D2404|nr:helix-turn-helix transcriptional regulator [Enterococcus cecorum]
MAVCYDKLFHLMIDKKISNVQLKDMAGVSANIITRLKRDEYISTESIEKICLALNCGVDDILEFIPEEEGSNNAE